MAIIEEWVSSWAVTVLEWYAQTFMIFISPAMVVVQLELLVIIYLVLQVLGFLFPVVKRLTNTLFLPFRILHIWLHLEAAKKLGLQGPDSKEDLIITRFITSVNGDDRASMGIKAPKNTKDAYKIAMAPTKGAVILIALSFIISPILLIFGLIGFFIHLYILFGALTTLWSDGRDYLFVYQIAVINADLSSRYLAWVIPVFGISFMSTLVTTTDLFQALLAGVGFTGFYLLGLLWFVARFSKQDEKPVSPKESPTIKVNAIIPFPEITLPSTKQ
ncbi:MAG: hypothetical protein ACFFC7_24360 [Candidatus Hermodarchaeota archaeon]